MITFQSESFDKAYADAFKFFQEHFEEVGENKDILGPPDCDMNAYRELERRNVLLIVTARDGDQLIGYLNAIIMRNPRYKSVVVSSVDVYYIDPRYRNHGVGAGLFKAYEEIAAERGAKLSVTGSKEAHDHSALFEGLGYRPFERRYCKRLAKG